MFKSQKDDFDEQTVCEASVCWSQYTTHYLEAKGEKERKKERKKEKKKERKKERKKESNKEKGK